MSARRFFAEHILRSGRARLVAAAFLMVSSNAALGASLVDIANDASDPFNLGDTEPSIAVNPTDPNKIAVVSFSENWGPDRMAPVWKSDDGGATWRKVFQIPQPAPGLGGPGDQKIAFDAAGRLYVVELGSGPRDFVYRQTGAPDAPLTPGVAFGDDQPHLDVDKSAGGGCLNRLYSPWLNFTPANPRSMVSESINFGVTMTDHAVGDPNFANRTTRIALASDGKAYVVYKTREGSAPFSLPGSMSSDFENAHFRVVRTDNCGATWSALGATGVSVHGATAVQTLFTDKFGNSTKGKVGRARSSDAWIAVDPGSGEVYVAFVRRDSSNFSQIYVARSSDQGVSWTTNRVTDGTHHAGYPNIAVNDTGSVGVLYIDFDDSGEKTIFRHRFASSVDDGATWSDEILQSMDPGPLFNAGTGFLWGDYEGLTAAGNSFYGVFTGQSIGRARLQLDPIFFKVDVARPPLLDYAVKFVCGKPNTPVAAPGIYFTAINVHNPGQSITFKKKIAVALPGEKAGKVTRFFDAKLGPDEALEIDCPDILKHAETRDFLKGFVVIETASELDVVAVYTAAGSTGQVETLFIERVSPRGLAAVGKPDLVPVNPDPSKGRLGFCRGDPNKLVFTVKNQGVGPAGPSHMTVTFGSGPSVSVSTPPLQAGASVDLPVAVPPQCFHPDCPFTIKVDSNSEVDESDENNNVADGYCLG
jgi:CARDB protein